MPTWVSHWDLDGLPRPIAPLDEQDHALQEKKKSEVWVVIVKTGKAVIVDGAHLTTRLGNITLYNRVRTPLIYVCWDILLSGNGHRASPCEALKKSKKVLFGAHAGTYLQKDNVFFFLRERFNTKRRKRQTNCVWWVGICRLFIWHYIFGDLFFLVFTGGWVGVSWELFS